MPISMAVFGDDAFTQASMIRGIEKRPYVPNGLDQIMGFTPAPVTTDVVYIGQRNRTNNLIQSTLRGAPIEMREREGANFRPIKIPRLAEGDQLFAHELATMTPFEDETDVETVASRIAEMQEDLIGDLDMTEEHMRLGSLNGQVLDKNGSVIVDYYDEFGIVEPAAIDLGLEDQTKTVGQLREAIGTQIVMPVARGAGQGMAPRMEIRALCGDEFFFALTGHQAIAETYLNQAAAAELREERIWDTFRFAGVTWYHFRGTDDGSTISIPSNQARIFPFGLRGMFQHVMGAANEFLNLMGQRGRRYVPFLLRDNDRDQWVQPEIYAYPLFVNARPDLVLTAQV